MGVPVGWEAGETWRKYATMLNMLKKCEMEKVKKMGRSRECKVQEMGGLDPPPPPPTKKKKTFTYLDQNKDNA